MNPTALGTLLGVMVGIFVAQLGMVPAALIAGPLIAHQWTKAGSRRRRRPVSGRLAASLSGGLLLGLLVLALSWIGNSMGEFG